MAHRITGALRIHVLAEIGLETVLEDRLQRAVDMFECKWRFNSVDTRHPDPDNPVRETPGPILVFRAFATEYTLNGSPEETTFYLSKRSPTKQKRTS